MLHYLVRSIQTIFNDNALESFLSGQENFGFIGVRRHNKRMTFIYKTKKEGQTKVRRKNREHRQKIVRKPVRL